jgi:hypothetical protein
VFHFISSCMHFVNGSSYKYKACIELHLVKYVVDRVYLAICESSGTFTNYM